jgi:hypothetical protein
VSGGTSVILHGIVLLVAVAAIRLTNISRAVSAWSRRRSPPHDRTVHAGT